MSFGEAVRQALLLLRVHPLRSMLTLFGLAWGTAAVVFLSSWGLGLREMNERAFQRAGRNVIMVWAGRISDDFRPAADRRFLWFTREDVAAVRERARLPDSVAGETRTHVPAAFGSRAMNFEVRGVEPEGIAIRGAHLTAGRFISRSDVEHQRRVVLIGHRARGRLLGPEGHVGSVVRLGGLPFRVVGVLQRVGTQLARDGDEIDDQIWVPLTTHIALWPNRSGIDADLINTILVRFGDRRLLDDTESEVRAILSRRLGVAGDDREAVQAFSPVGMLRRIPIDQQNVLNLVISATTILIGGVGVLSMMLDAVRERRSEIGIRLAVGAQRRDILFQFFLETAILIGIGGVLGIVFGISASLVLASDGLRAGIPPALNDLIPVPRLSPSTIGLAVLVLTATGVLSALVPARRAAEVDPAVTLRCE